MVGEKILQGQGRVREFYFESGKIEILKNVREISNDLTRLI